MTAPTRMSVVMDQLVAGARSSRDAAVNTLDAVARRSRAANAALVQQVAGICTEHPKYAEHPKHATERDARFDPEDGWNVAAPEALGDGAAASNTPVHRRLPVPDDDDYEGFPETWLR